MAKIISIEGAKRGTSQVKVETEKGDAFIIGFSSLAPVDDPKQYSSIICSILDDYSKLNDGDMFSFISMQMGRAKMELPLFLMPDRNEGRTRIGRQIRSIRENKRMDAKTLARLTDIDPANLSRIETGKFSAGLDTLCKIAMALDAKVEIVPNRVAAGKGFSMTRRVWVVNTGDYAAFSTLPAYEYIYLPNYGREITIGDLVICYNNGQYNCCGIVMRANVNKHEVVPYEFGNGYTCPDVDADSFMQINYFTGLTETEKKILYLRASEQIKGEPQGITLLEGVEL